jgi:hypothetical protein
MPCPINEIAAMAAMAAMARARMPDSLADRTGSRNWRPVA